MKSFNTKSVLSALGIVAMLTTSAFAQKPHRAARVGQSGLYDVIPGYDRDGRMIGIPDQDRFGAQSQR